MTDGANAALVEVLLRHADDNTILGQRLGEYISSAPELEEDLAIANGALDHIGVAMHLYEYAAEIAGGDASVDGYSMRRNEREFTNALIVEQPNTDFAHIVARSFLFGVYQKLLWEQLSRSSDERLAGIAARALKEATYHVTHARRWVVRLGDGTPESHARMQTAIDEMWRFTSELFEQPDIDSVLIESGVVFDITRERAKWDAAVDDALEEATLVRPEDPYQATGGRLGRHTEHLGHLLAEMQWLQRTYPGASW
ncbi:MAG: phenylacetate-CoA oxygenase subunit PaaI [Armatimonadetes bacterium]|nr:MAG: phenylacetate-CoA oxygenase subunit PaaI [Armatimonadota bacterium]